MPSNFKEAIIIDETRVCNQCIEYLINNKWKILFVVSDDNVVIDWAKKHFILTLPTSQLSTIKESNFYLVSIVNPYVIPKSLLANRNMVLALNYHDSLLPKCAGINSTTRAILNREKKHGVPLHKIISGIGDGDIIAQSTIDIEKDETAISLNLKCSECLLSLLHRVITKIKIGTLAFVEQNLFRAYYDSKSILTSHSIVNKIENLDRLSDWKKHHIGTSSLGYFYV